MKLFSKNHSPKKPIIMTALSTEVKVCSNCALWAGARELLPDGHIAIHPYSKGECQGDGFKHLSMAALSSCKCWEPWPQLPKPGNLPGRLLKESPLST